MIPLRDSEPSGAFPIVTASIIGVNSCVWFYEASLGARGADMVATHFGLIPYRFLFSTVLPGGVWNNAVAPMFTSMFLHAGWLHILGNMWFLWIFGDNVEDRLGRIRYLIFYILCGVGSGLLQIIFSPMSKIPMIGASGAISGVLGAYLLGFPHARIHTLLIIFIIIRFIEIPAFIFLLFWFVFQFVGGASQIGSPDSGGVAYWAHIGGFLVGMGLFAIMRKKPSSYHKGSPGSVY
ncbi:MAG: rhomboid family intramembrane serine protease [Desulfomonilaceae bacterium]|jgi:membrane associated rhomboid family serine protease